MFLFSSSSENLEVYLGFVVQGFSRNLKVTSRMFFGGMFCLFLLAEEILTVIRLQQVVLLQFDL